MSATLSEDMNILVCAKVHELVQVVIPLPQSVIPGIWCGAMNVVVDSVKRLGGEAKTHSYYYIEVKEDLCNGLSEEEDY